MEIITRQPLAQQVLKILLRRITSQGLNPGDRLPTERQLAEELGVGRGTIREALKGLEAIGAISRQSSKGCILRPVDLSFLAGISQQLLIRSPGDMAELFLARQVIEFNILPFVAYTATEEQFQDLEAANALMEAEINAGHVGIEGDSAFHQALLAASNNKFLVQFGGLIHEYFGEARYRILLDEKDAKKGLSEHKKITQDLRDKDVKSAQKVMKEHLEIHLQKGLIQPDALNCNYERIISDYLS